MLETTDPADPKPHTTTAIGRLGEDLALAFFTACGFRLLARRVRRARGEIDLVVGRGNLVVFVEVKTRGPGSWAPAHAAVSAAQLRRLRAAARAWIAEQQVIDAASGRQLVRGQTVAGQPACKGRDLRCDVVAVQFGGEGRGVVLRHFPAVA